MDAREREITGWPKRAWTFTFGTLELDDHKHHQMWQAKRLFARKPKKTSNSHTIFHGLHQGEQIGVVEQGVILMVTETPQLNELQAETF